VKDFAELSARLRSPVGVREMQDYFLVAVGTAIVLCAIYLAVRTDKSAVTIALVFVGFVCSVMAAYKGQILPSVEGAGWKLSFEQTRNTIIDLNKTDIGPMRSDIQDIRVKLASQNDFDIKITERINGLLQASPSIGTSLVAPDLKAAPVDSRNGKYATIIFYRDSRLDDATNVRRLLTADGFNASMINSNLDEVTLSPKDPGSTIIDMTSHGNDVVSDVQKIVVKGLGSPENKAVSVQGPFQLRRGDVQIYLF